MNPTLSPLLAYPTELLRQVYALPLVPQTNLPFNLLFTMNAIRLNLEYSKSQRGVERGYLQVFLVFFGSKYVEFAERYYASVYERFSGCCTSTTDAGVYYFRNLPPHPFVRLHI